MSRNDAVLEALPDPGVATRGSSTTSSRALRARRIVEFGTSYGGSTIYPALAVRDNGGGRVIGTEQVPAKAAEYLAWVRDPANGFASSLLPLNEGTELSVRVGPGAGSA